MKKVLILPLMLLNTLLFAQQQQQQDTLKSPELKEVTIVGDKGKSIPGSGQYVGIKKLEKINQSNVNNVLRIVPGVNVRDEEGFGLRPNIGLRGTPVNRSSKITLMEDGILIAPAPYCDPSAYYFPTFARMKGIEVLKGSSQIKYGPYTIGGAVNLLSTAIPNSFKGFAQLSYGSFNTNQQRIWVGDSRKNIDYVFEINRLASDGFKTIDNGGNSGFDRRDVMGKLRWHTKEEATIQQSLTLKFVNSTEKGKETYLGLTYNDYKKNALRRYAGTQKDALELSHQHISLNHSIVPAKQLSINTTAYYSNTFRDWARANTFGGQSISSVLNDATAQQTAYNIMTGQEDGNIQYTGAERTYISRGVQLNANYFFNTKNITHKFQLGGRYHTDEADRYTTNSDYIMTNGSMTLATAGVKGNKENQIRSANSWATYLSYEIQYQGLKVSPGIRYENMNFDIQNFGKSDTERLGTELLTATNKLSVLLPGIGVNYDISENMGFFGGVHKGFSPPGMPSVSSSTGQQAKAESSVNYELGYRYETQALNFQTTGFLNNYANILGSDNISGGGAGTGDVFNAGKAKIQGVEVSLAYDLLNKKQSSNEIKLPFSLAYTYTCAKFQETFVNGGGDWGSGTITKGDFIPFITPHLLAASLGFETKKFDVTISSRYTSKTRIKPAQDAIIVPAENVGLANINGLEQFLILDLSANYKFNKNFTVFTMLNNLTNSKAIVANLPQGYRPNIPLSFNMGVKANF